jgi:hypothetical protein
MVKVAGFKGLAEVYGGKVAAKRQCREGVF